MKPKTILWSWLVLAFIATGVLILNGCDSRDAELAAQREKELKAVRTELEQAKTSIAALESDVTQLRKDNQDLLRLRNEVRQLREDKQVFARQAQTAQTAAQRAQAQANELAEAEKQRIPALNRQTEYESRIKAAADANGGLTSPQGQATGDCISNLRQIDGAVQQWALENSKDTNAVPRVEDIAAYLKDSIPKCPAGGTYLLNSVGMVPTCTIPGHAMPQ